MSCLVNSGNPTWWDLQPCCYRRMKKRTLDLSPSTARPLAWTAWRAFLGSAARATDPNGRPPYNIEQVEDNSYCLEIAVAGFTTDDLSVEVKEHQLTVSGAKKDGGQDPGQRFYLHRGLAQRSFDLRFH